MKINIFKRKKILNDNSTYERIENLLNDIDVLYGNGLEIERIGRLNNVRALVNRTHGLHVKTMNEYKNHKLYTKFIISHIEFINAMLDSIEKDMSEKFPRFNKAR